MSVTQAAILPKQPVNATVTLADGKRVAGQFFVATASPTHQGPETLLDLLNDGSRAFVPFRSGGSLLFLNRVAINFVEFDSSEMRALFAGKENVYTLSLVVGAAGDQNVLNGLCYTGDMHPEDRRPIDLLNRPDMFLLLFHDNCITLHNKNTISRVRVL